MKNCSVTHTHKNPNLHLLAGFPSGCACMDLNNKAWLKIPNQAGTQSQPRSEHCPMSPARAQELGTRSKRQLGDSSSNTELSTRSTSGIGEQPPQIPGNHTEGGPRTTTTSSTESSSPSHLLSDSRDILGDASSGRHHTPLWAGAVVTLLYPKSC